MPATLRDPDHIEATVMNLIGHELCSPLTTIMGYAETLLRHAGRLEPEDVEEFHVAILQAANRLAHRIDRLLELVQLRAGVVPLLLETVDVAELARTALATAYLGVGSQYTPTFALRLLAEEDGELASADPFLVTGDEQRLHAVLVHVIENALKSSPPRGAVDVFVRSTSRERVLLEAVTRGYVELEASTTFGTVGHYSSQLPVDRAIEVGVADSGAGIPAEHLRRIFDPFYPVDRLLTREGEGLGLPICQEIIRLHGGLIWAESAAGAGNSFHMLLPQRYEQAAAAAIPAVRVLSR